MKNTILYASATYGEPEKKLVLDVFDKGWLSNGYYTDLFEKKLADWWGVKYAVAVNSGSSANFIATQALSLRQGSEVLTMAMGFPTTISPIIYHNLKPVYLDCHVPSYTIKLDETLISKDTSALIFAHTLGNVANMDEVMAFVKKYNLKLIEDCCFVGETLITTKDGQKPIKDIKVNDLVLTRNGYKKVLASEQTGYKKVISQFGITATPDHPFITKNGVKRFDKLIASDIIYICNEKQSSIREISITDIQKLSKDKEGFISGDIRKKIQSRFIVKSGLIILEKFLKAILSIIKMGILLIIRLITWSVSLIKNILKSILPKKWKEKLGQILKSLEKKLLNGTKVMRVEGSTQELPSCLTRIEKTIRKIAKSVENHIQLISQRDQCTAPENVNQKATKRDFVYNLTIEDNHEFFANGVLVHNCDAVGSEWKGQKVGTFGDLATVSFYPAHHMTTFGEGGAVLTNDKHLYNRCKSIRDWGKDCTCKYNEGGCATRFSNPPFDHRYFYTSIGLNFKMIEASAAFGLAQLDRLNGFIQKRKENYQFLESELKDFVQTPEVFEGASVSWFSFPIYHPNKTKAVSFLESKGVQTRSLFSGNILNHPAYRNSGRFNNLDNSDKVFEHTFFVGLGPAIRKSQLQYMVRMIKETL